MTAATTDERKESQRYWTSIGDRRQALKALGERLTSRQEFHILGAGIAGLAAAHEILNLPPVGGRRHRVVIYEGSDRVGGRIDTKRLGKPPRDGRPDTRPYFERGAMRIPTSHDYTWTYARELGLHRRRFLNDDRSHDFRGQVHRPVDLKALAEAYGVRDPRAWRCPPNDPDCRPGPGYLFRKNVLDPEMARLDSMRSTRGTGAAGCAESSRGSSIPPVCGVSMGGRCGTLSSTISGVRTRARSISSPT